MKKNQNNKLAFSLIELSIVILIIGILVIGVSKGSSLLTKSKISSAQSLTRNSPLTSITGLTLWLESTMEASFADDEEIDTDLGSDGTITIWNDINPHTTSLNNATQPGADNIKPRYVENGINGLPALNFDGIGAALTDRLELPGSDVLGLVNSDYEMFIVFQSSDTTGAHIMISGDSQGHYELRINNDTNLFFSHVANISVASITTGGQDLSAHIGSGRIMANGDSFISLDGSEVAGATGLALNSRISTTMVMGAREDNTYAFAGNIGELIIFDRALKASERVDIEEYLSNKWGIN
jgi:prepilin-type N-terminal cleavage/methylation domain-containing protein